MLTLTLVSIAAYSRLSLPAVSYVTNIDTWSITCLLFVAAALLECVVVDFLTKKNSRGRDSMDRIAEEKKRQLNCRGRIDISVKIKTMSRIAFPMLFVVFNVVFWITA